MATKSYSYHEQQHENSENLRILQAGVIACEITSKTCSDGCAKRLYKLKQGSTKIHPAEIEAEIKRKQKAFVIEYAVGTVWAKEFLNLKMAVLLLNVLLLALRGRSLVSKVRWPKAFY